MELLIAERLDLLHKCRGLFARGYHLLYFVRGFGAGKIDNQEYRDNNQSQYAVEEQLHRVVRSDVLQRSVTGIRSSQSVCVSPVVLAVETDRASAEEAEVVNLVRAEEDHEGNKRNLCQKENDAFDDLALHHVAEAHDDIGKFRSPVALDESGEITRYALADADTEFLEESADRLEDLDDIARKRDKEGLEIIPDLLERVELYIINIFHQFNSQLEVKSFIVC